MNWLGNSPHELGERSGLTGVALKKEWQSLYSGKNDSVEEKEEDGSVGNASGSINRENVLAKFIIYIYI